MRIVVGSQNRPKLQAVESSFGGAFPGQEIVVEGVATDSGVSSHPTSAEESLAGAMNRMTHAQELMSGADYYVGIEGGLLRVGEQAWELGWVAVSDALGKTSTGLSPAIEIRGAMLEAILSGTELNDVIEAKLGIHKIGNKTGYLGLATNDLVTRQASYEQGIILALAAFLHPELYTD